MAALNAGLFLASTSTPNAMKIRKRATKLPITICIPDGGRSQYIRIPSTKDTTTTIRAAPKHLIILELRIIKYVQELWIIDCVQVVKQTAWQDVVRRPNTTSSQSILDEFCAVSSKQIVVSGIGRVAHPCSIFPLDRASLLDDTTPVRQGRVT